MHAQCTATVSGTTVKMSNGTLSAEISGQAYVKKLNLGGTNLLTSNGIYCVAAFWLNHFMVATLGISPCMSSVT